MTLEEMTNRLEALEKKYELLESEWHDVCISSARFETELKGISTQMCDMKLEITKVLSEQMAKQWKLIVGLTIALVTYSVGAKLAPEILKALI